MRIGTRGSPLARRQTALVAASLCEAVPGLQIEVVPITTVGDRSQHTNQPGDGWGTGVFVKELEAALLRDDIDLAVHSLKDVPPAVSPELPLAAIPPRGDPRDVLVTLGGQALEGLPFGARVGTSSARRAAFLRVPRPDLRCLAIRGNVETRIDKLRAGEYDAIVLALAGLTRLELRAPFQVLEADILPPAPGQGALALQARAGDRDILEIAEQLHDPATGAAVRAERRLMANLEGGCRLPVGALGTPHADGRLELVGGVAEPHGRDAVIDRMEGSLFEPETLADALAARLRAAGATELIAVGEA
ncbi:MAG: hydroxymethylbilane synthase [Chloroflexota bacterium]|nr:hydroxymethylbilane synthase [Chloroflexota bacterium]